MLQQELWRPHVCCKGLTRVSQIKKTSTEIYGRNIHILFASSGRIDDNFNNVGKNLFWYENNDMIFFKDRWGIYENDEIKQTSICYLNMCD